MRSIALVTLLYTAACTPEPMPKKSMAAILSEHHLVLTYKTEPERIDAKGYYFVDGQDPQYREDITAAIEEMITNGHVAAVYYDRQQGLEAIPEAQTWRVPEQRIPSWGNGPHTITRRYEEHEQAYFIPLADITGRDAGNKINAPTYAVIIPETIENKVMIMYVEQTAHPEVEFYRYDLSDSITKQK